MPFDRYDFPPIVSAATNNAQVVKNTAGFIRGIQAFNLNAAPRYLKIYDKATVPAPGTDTALLQKSLMIPGNTAGAGFALDLNIALNSGISIAIVSGIANNDNTSISANEVVVNIDFQ
jgi:hypothetical protein